MHSVGRVIREKRLDLFSLFRSRAFGSLLSWMNLFALENPVHNNLKSTLLKRLFHLALAVIFWSISAKPRFKNLHFLFIIKVIHADLQKCGKWFTKNERREKAILPRHSFVNFSMNFSLILYFVYKEVFAHWLASLYNI